MTTLKRLSVVMSVFGTGILIAACASPTDAEIADQSSDVDTNASELSSPEEEAEDVAEDAERTAEDVGEGAERTAEDVGEGAERTAEDVGEDAEGAVSQEQQYGGVGGPQQGYGGGPQQGYGGGHGPGGARPYRCNYRHVQHCLRQHSGWRWINLGVSRSPGGHGRYGRGERPNFCCMRVQPGQHRY